MQVPRGWVPAVLGGIAGGAVGYLIYWWLLTQGLYALVLPGALLGIGWGYFSGRVSNTSAVICGVLGLALGIAAEWHRRPMIEDGSLLFFVSHLNRLQTATILMLVVGALMAAWFGRGR